MRDRRIPSNPARGVSLPRANHRRRKYLTAEKVAQLADEAATPPPLERLGRGGHHAQY